MVRSGDVAGAARTSTQTNCRVHHRLDHGRVLAHAEVVVRTPASHLARAARRMPDGGGQPTGNSLEANECPVPVLFLAAEGGTPRRGWPMWGTGAAEAIVE